MSLRGSRLGATAVVDFLEGSIEASRIVHTLGWSVFPVSQGRSRGGVRWPPTQGRASDRTDPVPSPIQTSETPSSTPTLTHQPKLPPAAGGRLDAVGVLNR
jgi:hypothetical protein